MCPGSSRKRLRCTADVKHHVGVAIVLRAVGPSTPAVMDKLRRDGGVEVHSSTRLTDGFEWELAGGVGCRDRPHRW